MAIYTQEELYEISRPVLDKIKVLFFVYFPSVWDSHRSIYEAMKASPSFEVYVFVAPVVDEHQQCRYREDILEFFENEGIDVILGCSLDISIYINIQSLNMDVVFYQTPFYAGIPEWFPENIAQHTYLAYVPYGIYTANIPDVQFNQIIHNVAWKVFAETPLHKELYAKYKLTGDRNVVVSGYPKLDIYTSHAHDTEYTSTMCITPQTTPSKKRILWTPHWIVDTETKYTLFAEYIEFFIDYLSQNTDSIEIILKPHPLLFGTLIKEGVYTKEELDHLLVQFESLPNGSIYQGGNYFPLFFSSDAMINSSISFIAEYLPTRKPMLFMPNKNDLGVNEFGEQIRNKHYMGYSKQDIIDFINHVVIENNDPMYAEREEAIRTIFYMPEEGAGVRIKEEIERSMRQDKYWCRKQKTLARRLRLEEKKAKANITTTQQEESLLDACS